MAVYEMSIRYTGDAVADGRMPIKDLAPALLALSGALQEIQQIKDPCSTPMSVEIKSTKDGSFIVDLLLRNGEDIVAQTIDLLTGKHANASANLIAYVGVLIACIKVIKGKGKAKSRTDQSVVFTLDTGEEIVFTKEDMKIYSSLEFREQVNNIIVPLENEGMDSVQFSSDKTETISVSHTDKNLFKVPKPDDQELDAVVNEVHLNLLNVAFEHGKWKFYDGNKGFYASIEDKAFLEDVKENKISFSTNDMLKVRLRTEQKLSAGALKAEFSVEEILEHFKTAEQLELDVS